MSPRPQVHLRQLVEEHGEAAGSRLIVDLLEQGLQEKQKQKDAARKEEKGPDHVQNPYFTDALKCERAVYFRLTGEPQTEPLTTDSLINFEVGHAVEEAFGLLLEFLPGVKVVREVGVEVEVNGIRVSGRLDFLLLLEEDGILIELKAINSRSLGYMLKRQMPGRDEHRAQLRLYLHTSQVGNLIVDDKPLKFDLGYLVYVVRDTTKGEPPIHAFPVPYDKEVAEGDLEWLSMVAHRAEQHADPGIPFGYEGPKKFPCAY